MSVNGDKHIEHDGKWEFDASVTENFEAMLSASIPSYTEMRRLVTLIGSRFIQPNSKIFDIGASRGDGIDALLRDDCEYTLFECSKPMVEVLNKKYGQRSNVRIVNSDVRSNTRMFHREDTSLVLSVLTLQFIPVEYRAKLLRMIYESLRPCGAFILVEKIQSTDSVIDNLLVSAYYKLKEQNGYTEHDILVKRRALEGVLVPLPSDTNVKMLHDAGFSRVECFFRALNFCGWVALP
jgi:tRNA (cmo5U34)-methyltransferase